MLDGARIIVTTGLALLGGCTTHTLIGGLSDGGGLSGSAGSGGAMPLIDAGIGGGGGGGMTQVCGPGNTDGGQPAGTPSFRAVDYVVAGSNFSSIAIGDISGDGKPDLAVISDQGVNLLVNNGDGSFQVPMTNPHLAGSPRLLMGDVNGDGKIDLAAIFAAGVGASVMINAGNGTFGAPMNYSVATQADSIALGDLDGDGAADIVLADLVDAQSSSVVVLLGTKSGTFTAVNYPVPGSPSSVAIGDLNGDGTPDLAVGSYNTGWGGGMLVLPNNGKGVFGAPATFGPSTNPNFIAIADLNGDGKADLVGMPGNGYVDVLLNSGAGTFTAPASYLNGGGSGDSQSFALGDFNNDGAPDIVLAGYEAGVRVLLNAGNGTFGAPATIPATCDSTDYSFRYLAIADLNRDGKTDIVVTIATGVEVLLNTSP